MLEASILCGMVGFVFVLLCRPYEILEGWRNWLAFMLNIKVVDFDQMKGWQIAIYKPLAACGKCFSGWFSIVVYIYSFGFPREPFTFTFFVFGAIFTAYVLERLDEKFLN